jgi:hypothetical protein
MSSSWAEPSILKLYLIDFFFNLPLLTSLEEDKGYSRSATLSAISMLDCDYRPIVPAPSSTALSEATGFKSSG